MLPCEGLLQNYAINYILEIDNLLKYNLKKKDYLRTYVTMLSVLTNLCLSFEVYNFFRVILQLILVEVTVGYIFIHLLLWLKKLYTGNIVTLDSSSSSRRISNIFLFTDVACVIGCYGILPVILYYLPFFFWETRLGKPIA